MRRIGFIIPLVLAFAIVLSSTTGAQDPPADPGTRESTYPQPIANVTHEPWEPGRGEDIRITLTLEAEAENPDRVQLVWCRIEPEYVCAQPVAFQEDAPRTWIATIPGSSGGDRDVIRDSTRHIGYNISLIHGTGGQAERTFAPTYNTWTPDSFPQDTGGIYYFVALGEPTQKAPGPFIAFIVLTLLAVTRILGMRPRPQGGDPHG